MPIPPDPNLAAIRRLSTSIPSLLIGLGEDRRILLWNPQAEKLLGCPAEDVLGRPLEACPVAWDPGRLSRALECCTPSGAPVSIEAMRCEQPGGPTAHLALTLISLGESGLFNVRTLIIGADTTQRKLLQEQLAQARKMQAIGHLAAGIAHEISTPAQFVGDNTHFLRDAFAGLTQVLDRCQALAACVRDRTPADDALQAFEASAREQDLDYLGGEIPLAIDHILDGVRRISKIVRSMKFFAHPGGAAEKSPLDLNEAIESTIVISRNEWKYVAEVETDLDPALPAVPGHRGEINQVLLNLVTNAAHAIGEKLGGSPGAKGRIHIGTCCRGGWAEVRIRDTGAGIPAAVQPKVFDLFFTTKQEGVGSGQGLAIAHSVIVENHGGELSFATEPGEGTTFLIRLPLGEEVPGHG